MQSNIRNAEQRQVGCLPVAKTYSHNIYCEFVLLIVYNCVHIIITIIHFG